MDPNQTVGARFETQDGERGTAVYTGRIHNEAMGYFTGFEVNLTPVATPDDADAAPDRRQFHAEVSVDGDTQQQTESWSVTDESATQLGIELADGTEIGGRYALSRAPCAEVEAELGYSIQ